MLLRSTDQESLIKIFSTCPIPIEVWAYGSRVNGDAFEGSDLDLVLRTQDLQPLPFEHFMDLKDKIVESTIPILVDLFDWPRLPASFHKNIEAHHEILFTQLPTTQ